MKTPGTVEEELRRRKTRVHWSISSCRRARVTWRRRFAVWPYCIQSSLSCVWWDTTTWRYSSTNWQEHTLKLWFVDALLILYFWLLKMSTNYLISYIIIVFLHMIKKGKKINVYDTSIKISLKFESFIFQWEYLYVVITYVQTQASTSCRF